jgi:hypothetical protein
VVVVKVVEPPIIERHATKRANLCRRIEWHEQRIDLSQRERGGLIVPVAGTMAGSIHERGIVARQWAVWLLDPAARAR